MSGAVPLRADRAEALTTEELATRVDALSGALDAGGDRLDPRAAEDARAVAEKVSERTRIVGGHTVVALAGATGSGKSSLFNTLVGADVATVGMRRPTTSTPTAAVWGTEPAGELLDWLSVGSRHQVPPDEGDDLDGLVLIDLPDFDSRQVEHRAEAERVLELVDVFVWVTDPQKYADAVLHEDYVGVLREYGAVTVVVLNQVDRLPRGGADEVSADLSRLLTRDGLTDHEVIATSTLSGAGTQTLRARLQEAVERSDASRHRLAADLRSAAESLSASVAEGEPRIPRRAGGELVDALARTAGVPTVVDAVARDHRLAAWAQTGWPFTRWVHALRPAPLRRLRLDRERDPDAPDITDRDVRAVLGRSSLPPPAPSARASVDLAVRRVGAQAGEGLPTRWADAVAHAARPVEDDLADELDLVLVRTPLRGRRPLWWAVAGALQAILALAAVVGLVWLLLGGIVAWLQLPELPRVEVVGAITLPFVLFVGGLLAGLLLAGLSRWLAGLGARRRARDADRALRKAIGQVAREQVLDPVERVLADHARTREGLAVVAG
ncbi:GTPase [Janibacter corallicola]|uniref:GTPase n=1 Tax=Janibacter corallicola TaxID=415212 RepID=UPI000A068EA7|nr:GTPase [Janibacter corallicola]